MVGNMQAFNNHVKGRLLNICFPTGHSDYRNGQGKYD